MWELCEHIFEKTLAGLLSLRGKSPFTEFSKFRLHNSHIYTIMAWVSSIHVV